MKKYKGHFEKEHMVKSVKNQLDYWKKQLETLKNGTIVYDGSMPESCINALIYNKVDNFAEALMYVESIKTEYLTTRDYHYYLSIVNR